ncbi:MAG: hypothetical protein HDR82_07340 [Bacteroides sp.]|nr:hypothetical protein [Bacteroides sp.]
MKITLTETFIDSITTLPNMIANQVLNTCRELIKLDNDAIEQYELPADAPQLLHDIVTDMKKRAIAARRRRERREAKAQAQTQSRSDLQAQSVSDTTTTTPAPATTVTPEYAEAINLLFSDSTIHTPEHRALMHKLVVFIADRISASPQESVVQTTGTTSKKSRRKRKRNRRR